MHTTYAAIFALSVQQLFIPVDFISAFHLFCVGSLAARNSRKFRSGYSALVDNVRNRNKTVAREMICLTSFRNDSDGA